MYVPWHMSSLVAKHLVNSFFPANNSGVQHMNVKLGASTERNLMGHTTHGVARKRRPTTSPASPRKKRRLKTTPTDSAEPQKSQASQSRLTKPTKKYDQNYPLLLLQNWVSALQDSTPDPQPEPRPRSGSLPGYTTKQPTPPPPPPPKPKTPSYIQALLSQKPPTPSE
ncbi:hypothetical protein HPB51_016694 [Rhipicephalus microplus]|uniref:Uncharacterized protein n=1 Tax=Rhipicephalus microplus TaxID=6941 RepID=A0A9J6D6F9_RHIMP|nr:hypothetical protein HPB51_016694 [Rhipicephalus microplus]